MTLPMLSRIPPPFLIEITTSGSASCATAKLASAVRLPRLVSSVRTSPRIPLRNTSLLPKILPSCSAITSDRPSVISTTSESGVPSTAATPSASVAYAPLISGSILSGIITPFSSKSTTKRPT